MSAGRGGGGAGGGGAPRTPPGGGGGRRRDLEHPPAAEAAEHVQVEEVHGAEDEQDESDLDRQRLDGVGGGGDRVGHPDRDRRVSEVEQVEANHQQVVDRLGEALVAE